MLGCCFFCNCRQKEFIFFFLLSLTVPIPSSFLFLVWWRAANQPISNLIRYPSTPPVKNFMLVGQDILELKHASVHIDISFCYSMHGLFGSRAQEEEET